MSAVVAAAGPELSPQTLTWVQQATARCRLAGPDGDAVHLDRRFGLGHALLRTGPADIDGPITLDGRTWLSADVRLDDRTGLIADLRASGRAVTPTTADAELMLHAHGVWPATFLDHLAGDFAFALWDGEQLICARDQLGVLPLYYVRHGSDVLVSTSIDALLMHPAVSADLDEAWIADFLLTAVPADFESSVYREIRRLAPAHTLVWSNGSVAIRRYWSLPDYVPLLRLPTVQDYPRRFGELLDAAVSDRITSDVVSVQLSGGMDCTSVAAGATAALRARGAPPSAIRGVSGTLGGASGDREGELAARVAERLGIRLELIDGSLLPPLDPMQDPVPRLPEPAPYRRTTFEYDLARTLAPHAPVLLTGVGGDVLLGSNQWYLLEWLADRQFGRTASAVAGHVALFRTLLRPGIRSGLRQLRSRRSAPEFVVPDWLDGGLRTRTQIDDRLPPSSSPVTSRDARSLVADPFWATMCELGHPAVSGLPVRARHPMLDLRLIRFVRALPPQPWLVDKYLLREAMRDRLPEQVRVRPKTLLVDAPRPGRTAESLDALCALVRDTPEIGGFADPDILSSRVRAMSAEAGVGSELELSRPLGLAHWLMHRPNRSGGTDPGAEPPRMV